MWTIIKFDNKQISFLKKDLEKKLDPECKFYIPKLLLKKIKKKKIIKKEINLLGNYLFCFSKNFKDKKKINSINYARGLKLVLNGFEQSQSEIHEFIKKCQSSENNEGYVSEELYELKPNKDYKFFSGPFTNSIFKILELQKNKIKVMMGDLKTTINKKEFLFQPV